jgi:DNA processing protein
MNEEQKSLLILTHIPQLGAIRIRKLKEYFGTAQAVLEADTASLQEVPGLGLKTVQQITSWKTNLSWQKDLELVERYRVQLLSETDPLYPRDLRDLKDAPVLLYVLGTLKSEDQRSIAVVGTRQASHYGKEMAEQFAADLVSYGATVVSGLARGIDTAAHEAALKKGGRTLAVIGSGLANLYPKENAPLARRITESGAVLSEYPMNTAPDRTLFPRRNRIVSGMSTATLLIEAPVKSGAMLTAERTLAQDKPLFVVPGRLDSETFAGNHKLLKEGKGRFTSSARDLCLSLEWTLNTETSPKKEGKAQLTPEEQLFLSQLPQEEFDLETVLIRTKLAPSRANVLLIGLVLKKQIKEYPGRVYKKSGKN